MKKIINTFLVEYKKALRSKIFFGSIIFMLIVSFIIGILFYIVKNPDLAKTSVILRAKASIIDNPNWKTFGDIMNLMIAIIGFLSFNVVTAWVFGREYSDKTIKDILSLPISRLYIVISKHIVIFVWCLFLSLLLYIFSFTAALIVGLNDFRFDYLFNGIKIYFFIAIMNIFLVPVISFLSSIGKGYFLAFGAILLLLLISNFAINVSENAKYFPWAVPLIYAGSALKDGINISIIILFITGIMGLILTLYWWKYGDHC